MARTALVVLAAVALLLTGCAADSGGTGGSGDDTVSDPGGPDGPDGPDDGPRPPTGADDVVLRIQTAGGYVPVDYAFATVPTVLATGDGTVIQPAPGATDISRPRLLPLVQHTVDEAILEDLLRLADEHGLLAEPPDYSEGAPMVTDMASTTVVVTADGETWTHTAYALGFEEEQGRRAALEDFVAQAVDLLDEGATEPYRPTAVRLFASELTEQAGAGDYPVATDFPAAVHLAAAGECLLVEDPAAVAAVVETMTGSPDDSLFRQGRRTWSVTAAAVLPGDARPCAGW